MSERWTDGKNSKEEYVSAFALWSALYDRLPDSSSSKIPAKVRGIMLQSQLYSKGENLCKKASKTVTHSAAGTAAIADAIFKREALSTVSNFHHDFITLLNLEWRQNEIFRKFESHSEAQVSTFKTHFDTSTLEQSLTALLFHVNLNSITNQRISVLAAAASSSINESSTADDYLSAISSESVVSALPQLDHSKNAKTHSPAFKSIQASGILPQLPTLTKGKARKSLMLSSLLTLKVRSALKREILRETLNQATVKWAV